MGAAWPRRATDARKRVRLTPNARRHTHNTPCHVTPIQPSARVTCATSTEGGVRPASADSGAGFTPGYPALASCQEYCLHCRPKTGTVVASIQRFLLSPHIKRSATSYQCSVKSLNGCRTFGHLEAQLQSSEVGRNPSTSPRSRLTSALGSSRHGPRLLQAVGNTCRFRTTHQSPLSRQSRATIRSFESILRASPAKTTMTPDPSLKRSANGRPPGPARPLPFQKRPSSAPVCATSPA